MLATLLTIFPTIQASRLRQPDSTQLAGLLTMRHFQVGLLTAVPGLALAAVLAFAPEGRRLLVAAIVAVLLQLGCHLWIRGLGQAATTRTPARRRPRVTLATDRAADHRAFDVLRSAWCRSLTGEVLLLGRSAYPFVAVDRDEPGALADLLAGAQGELAAVPEPRLRPVLRDLRPAPPRSRDPAGDDRAPVNLLGMLRGTAVGRSATFLVFRDPPKPDWLAAAAARDGAGHLLREIRPMTADRTRLAPMEPPDWVLDVMIGRGRRAGLRRPAAGPDRPGRAAGQLHPAQRPAAGAAAAAGRGRAAVAAAAGGGRHTGAGLAAQAGPVPRRAGRAAVGRACSCTCARCRRWSRWTRPRPRRRTRSTSCPARRVPTTGKTVTGRLVTDHDIQVPAGPADSWRLVAVLAQPRSGLLAETLAALHEHAGVRALAGAISGVFDGTMVVFLLCRATDRGRRIPTRWRLVEEATRPYRTAVRLLDGVRPGPDGAGGASPAAAGADPYAGPARA